MGLRPVDIIAARERFHRAQAAHARSILARGLGPENSQALNDLVSDQVARAEVLQDLLALYDMSARHREALLALLPWVLGRPSAERPYWTGWDPGLEVHRHRPKRQGRSGPQHTRTDRRRG